MNGDARDLAEALRSAIEGEVRFDASSRAIWSTDSSNYRQVPIGVVLPRSTDDIVATVRLAREFGAPILGRGAGTSLAGQCCNVAVVIDTSRYLNRILELDPDRKRARVQPGIVLDRVREAAETFHLTFGPDPATHSRCTIGGMIGNNSCGVHSVMSGKTDENIESLDILTYDGVRMTVGPTPDDELERIVTEGGRRGEIYAALRSIRDRYADGIRERFPKIRRVVSGYGLPHLLPENGFNVARALTGTESTCALTLEAELKLVHSPPVRRLVVLGYNDVFAAADHVMEILEYGPIGLEGIDDGLVGDMKRKSLHLDDVALLPEGAGWLFVEFGGETEDEARGKVEHFMTTIHGCRSMRLAESPSIAGRFWRVRESALGAAANVPGQKHAWEGWEDAAVHPAKLGGYLRKLRALFDEYGYRGNLYGHFGDGCVHTRNDFDLESAEGIAKYRAFVTEAAHLVVSLGGSISGEHGDGQSRGELLPIQFGDEIVEAFREFKRAWDPEWKMNPGKLIDPYPLDSNLRLGAAYRPATPSTRFHYPQDEGLIANAALRCVGVGACRRENGGTMCPSWLATHEEMHSTRGRARLLFEMLRGEVIVDGWRSEEVKEALDLCLACKGCRADCPVGVDMATYKAEFLSHYYDEKPRPIRAYAIGYVDKLLALGAMAPKLANALATLPVLSGIVRKLLGVATERELPKLADETFRKWFGKRTGIGVRDPGTGETPLSSRVPARDPLPENERVALGGDPSSLAPLASRDDVSPDPRSPVPVLLFPDTFNNYLTPDVSKAAVEVLEAAGCEVRIPETQLCCGRPLYDYGLLDEAKRKLRAILDAWRDDIRAGTPIVGLEPSCIAVFRDELVNFFPDDEDALALSKQVFTLAEFLEARGWMPPKLDAKAIVQPHCHHRSVMGRKHDAAILDAMGVAATTLDDGCCGMAGAFGFEEAHYDVSVACAERELLPAIESADDATLVLADGFSCREQIGQLSHRRARHLAEVLADALRR